MRETDGIDGSPSDITTQLARWSAGDAQGLEALLPLVYQELRQIAEQVFRRERPGHTLQPTALVHEAFLKLTGGATSFRDRAHFYAVASQAMRQVLVDHARARHSQKRGRNPVRVGLHELDGARGSAPLAGAGPEEVIAVDDALRRLAALDLEQARLVELRVFGGLTIDEMAEVLEISTATVKRHWRLPRAFLLRELAPS